MNQRFSWPALLGFFGLGLLLYGSWYGLFVAPPELYMGEVARIMYVHVPCAWVAMLCYTFAFGFAIASLWTQKAKWDAILTATIEVGIVLNALLLLQGMIWARATWGVWWDWDVRLTTSLVMLLLFTGVLALRSFVKEVDRRSSWTAVAAIISFVDVPLVYFCVRWWRSLHQVQSSPETVSSGMVLPLRINAFAILFLAIFFAAKRTQVELSRLRSEVVEAPARRATLEGENS